MHDERIPRTVINWEVEEEGGGGEREGDHWNQGRKKFIHLYENERYKRTISGTQMHGKAKYNNNINYICKLC